MTKKRILIASNYDDELFTESFYDFPPVETDHGQSICDDLNSTDPMGPRHYKLVDVDYTPYEFTP